MLSGEGREVATLGSLRSGPDEQPDAHVDRLAASFEAARARFAWLCVAPGAHAPVIARAALQAGLHLVVEKPWRYPEHTPALRLLAAERGLVVGVDFEFCLLEGVQRWAAGLGGGAGLRFGGVFDVATPDHLGVPAIDNLGSHLLAIREVAAPAAELGAIRCGYERPAARAVWLDRGGKTLERLDFAQSREPILQRLVQTFEAASEQGSFPLDLALAERVVLASEAAEAAGLIS